jgi:hypothetical protein
VARAIPRSMWLPGVLRSVPASAPQGFLRGSDPTKNLAWIFAGFDLQTMDYKPGDALMTSPGPDHKIRAQRILDALPKVPNFPHGAGAPVRASLQDDELSHGPASMLRHCQDAGMAVITMLRSGRPLPGTSGPFSRITFTGQHSWHMRT